MDGWIALYTEGSQLFGYQHLKKNTLFCVSHKKKVFQIWNFNSLVGQWQLIRFRVNDYID